MSLEEAIIEKFDPVFKKPETAYNALIDHLLKDVDGFSTLCCAQNFGAEKLRAMFYNDVCYYLESYDGGSMREMSFLMGLH